MSARTRVWGACRTLAIRSQPAHPKTSPFLRTRAYLRPYSDDVSSKPSTPSIKPESRESAQPVRAPVAKDVNAEGTSASSGLTQGSAEEAANSGLESHISALDDATLEQILYGGRTASSKQEGGLTAAQQEVLYRDGTIPPAQAAETALATTVNSSSLESTSSAAIEDIENPGHKFGLPSRPYPEGFHLKRRYHPVLDQIVRLVMRDGKLSVAQRHMVEVMNYLRTAPPPIYSPKYPLLPGTPPASHLSLDPILYITVAIDSVAPLIMVKNISGAGGGGRSLELPMPLAVRQRRRMAFKWILDVVEKKPSKGSGRKQLAHRIAEEIIAVVEGRSSVWEKRRLMHKVGTAARANVNSNKLKVKKKK